MKPIARVIGGFLLVSLLALLVGSVAAPGGLLTRLFRFQNPSAEAQQNQPASPASTNISSVANLDAADHYEGMSDLEFSHLRVKLPRPRVEDWETPFLKKKDALKDRDSKLQLLDLLPLWIRLSLRDRPQQTPGFLETLIQLTRDPDIIVSIRASLELYRLGDFDEIAAKQIKTLFNDFFGAAEKGPDATLALQQLLDEISRNKDSQFDGLLKRLWEKHHSRELNQSLFVDIGRYLEESGHTLPETYWMDRGRQNQDLAALNILFSKPSPETTRFFQETFSSSSSILKNYAAAYLYLKDPQPAYWTHLEQAVSEGLREGFSNEIEAQVSLQSLVRADFEKARPHVESALKSEDEIIRISAHHALSTIPHPSASDLLFQSAIDQLRRSLFPESELRALVAQGTTYADTKYQKLRELALQPPQDFQVHGAWSPSDFAAVEFERKHRRLQ